MSSASRESQKFLKAFAAYRRVLNFVVSFKPHYAVFSMEKADQDTASNLCSDASGKFCAEDPDGPGPITGREVLAEDVRQLCIHEIYKKVQPRDDPASSKLPANIASMKANVLEATARAAGWVEYAAEYWSYVELFAERCPPE